MKKLKKTKYDRRNKAIDSSKKLTSIMLQENIENSSEQDFGGIPERDFKKNLGCG